MQERHAGFPETEPQASSVVPASLAPLRSRWLTPCVAGLLALAVVGALSLGQYILAPVTAAVLFGLTFGPVSDRLTARIGSAELSAGLIVVACLGVIATAGVTLALPLEQWSQRAPVVMERMQAEWQQIRQPLEQIKAVEQQVEEATREANAPEKVVIERQGVVTNMISSAPDILARILLFIGAFYFFLVCRKSLRRGLLTLFSSFSRRCRVARALRVAEGRLSQYFMTISIINAGLGLCVGTAMWAIGLPSPHLWGALAFGLNFAPFIGPAVMTLILIGVGFATLDGLGAALVPAGIFVVLNLLEGQFVTPSILGKRIVANPFVVFVAIAGLLWLWGGIGAFVAVPLVIVVAVFTERVGDWSASPAPATAVRAPGSR
ncbi:MAG: AI-2E family transporter [Pseudomonadota bacterium]